MLTRALPRTIRYLLLRDGASVNDRLTRYFGANPPKLYAPLEALGFAEWLKCDCENDEILVTLIDFDLAFLRVVRKGTPVIVRCPGNPASVFEALAEKRLPAVPDPPAWELEILPDSFSVDEFAVSAPGS